MPRKHLTAEEIIHKLREAEVLLVQGQKTREVCRKLGVAKQAYYRWRKEYGGIKVDQAKQLWELEKENSRLKRLLAEAGLDKAILREAASGPQCGWACAGWARCDIVSSRRHRQSPPGHRRSAG